MESLIEMKSFFDNAILIVAVIGFIVWVLSHFVETDPTKPGEDFPCLCAHGCENCARGKES